VEALRQGRRRLVREERSDACGTGTEQI